MLSTARHLNCSLGDRRVWQDLNLTVRPGDRVAVTRPSGSGKSLFLRALAGLDPLESGEVALRGRPQTDWPMPEYCAQVMYLPQRPALGSGTAEQALRGPFALKVHAQRSFNEQAVGALLQALGRPPTLLALDVATLSGGEGQLVALMRALLLDPSVLLLDEATASLDPEATHAAEALLERWVAAGPERALVWVSHDPVQRRRVATRELPVVGAPERGSA